MNYLKNSCFNSTSNSLLINKLKKLNLGSNLYLERFSSGIENENYLLKTENKKYVVRIYLKRSLEEIKYEISILKKLSKYNFVPDVKSRIIPIEKKFFVVFEYIPGKMLSQLNSISEKDLSKLCKKIFLIHKSLLKFHPSGSKKRYRIDDLSFVSMKSNLDPNLKLIIESEIKFLESKKIDYDTLTKSIIHEDISPNNIISCQDKLSIIDFDDAHHGPIVSDISTLIKSLIIDVEGLNFKKINICLESYGLNNLQKQDLSIIYYLLRRRTLFMIIYVSLLPKENIKRDQMINNEQKSLKILKSISFDEFNKKIGI